jgi:fucose 4-O-acetylase-like acetyltransferase
MSEIAATAARAGQMPVQDAPSAARLLDIDTAKGIGIVLVVLGHVVAQQVPAGHEWYRLLKDAIYAFHMPFFLYLSGYVLGYSAKAWTAEKRRFVLERLDRLILPFFAFGLIIIAGKMALSTVLHVDNTQEGLAAYLDGLFIHTSRSPATSVWYLYAAFIYAVFFRFVVAPFPRLLPLMILVAAILPHLEIPNLFYADRVLKFLVFFLVGVFAGHNRAIADALVRRYGVLALVIFAAALAAALQWTTSLTLFAAALLSLPAVHFLACWLVDRDDKVFAFFGAYTMAIYLFNTIAIGFTKGVGFLVRNWDGSAFYVYFVVLTAAGLLLPIAARLVMERIAPPLARYMR